SQTVLPNHLNLYSFPTRRSSDLARARLTIRIEAVEQTQLRFAINRQGGILGQERKTLPSLGPYQMQTHGLSQLAFGCFQRPVTADRKSTRLNSSHVKTSYAVFCL